MFRKKEESLNRINKQRIAMMSATEIDRPDLFTEKFPKPLKMMTLRSEVNQYYQFNFLYVQLYIITWDHSNRAALINFETLKLVDVIK